MSNTVTPSVSVEILSYIPADQAYQIESGIYQFPWSRRSAGLEANAYYFSHSEWSKAYFEACHRDPMFIEAWSKAIQTWQDKIVVDIGCGPGNLYAALQPSLGQPKQLIGVDVAMGALKTAQKLGYIPVLADAQALPFESGWADLVMVNATLHHCDDMAQTLAEAARLVKPGGYLITDHDPQFSAWNFRGLGKVLWQFRLPLYRWVGRGGHGSPEEQRCGLTSEIHHRPGAGVTPALYHQVLTPLGFEMKVFPHSHQIGAALFDGQYGKSFFKCRLAQRLSGIDPTAPEAALSLMCVAQRRSLSNDAN